MLLIWLSFQLLKITIICRITFAQRRMKDTFLFLFLKVRLHFTFTPSPTSFTLFTHLISKVGVAMRGLVWVLTQPKLVPHLIKQISTRPYLIRGFSYLKSKPYLQTIHHNSYPTRPYPLLLLNT